MPASTAIEKVEKPGYVARAIRGGRGSVLGNPFKIKNESERANVIARYEEWLRERIAAEDREVINELNRPAAKFRAEERLVLLLLVRAEGVSRRSDPGHDPRARQVNMRSLSCSLFMAQQLS